jgi:hypothetical protein
MAKALVPVKLLNKEAKAMLKSFIPKEPRAPGAPEIDDEVLDLLKDGVVGKPLRKAVKALDATPALVLTTVLTHLLAKAGGEGAKMVGKNDEDENCVVDIADGGDYEKMLSSKVGKAEVDEQKACIVAVADFCHSVGFPDKLCETLFMTLSDAEIIDEESFFAWRDDATPSVGRVQARKETLAWMTWLEENAGSDSDSESDEE